MRFLMTQEIQVRWGDMDALGHVNNATYFSYFEICRTAWLESLNIGIGSRGKNNAIVLAHVEADYLLPLSYPANVVVKMYADKPGNTSLKTYYELIDLNDPSKIHVKSQAVLVWFDLKTQKSTSIAQEVIDLFDVSVR